MEVLAASLSEKIDISAFNQLRWFDTEFCHELMGLPDTDFGGLALRKNNLQLQEMPQAFDFVQVDSRSADKKKCSVLQSDMIPFFTFYSSSVHHPFTPP